MAIYRKVWKGKNPPGVGGVGRNEKDNEKDKYIWRKQGDTESKGIEAVHGLFRRSAWHHSDTTFSSTGDTLADEVKKRDRIPSLEGTKKPTAVEGEYNRFTITPFHICIIWTTRFHQISISPCEHGCVFYAPFHRTHFTIALYQSISPSHHFTMWTWVCIMYPISPYLFHNSSVPIHFTISPFHLFAIILKFHSKET